VVWSFEFEFFVVWAGVVVKLLCCCVLKCGFLVYGCFVCGVVGFVLWGGGLFLVVVGVLLVWGVWFYV
jgi:hypothetical protein